ncbi:MarR family winged helix-turn-helix transcriptional regulator [Bosea sp. NBC_00550]|uniref:MarR family winged helix-turn-helix transcriptional regulator n=1 Tax=Bosea sp. NBC_00550 TaxID=2969621 RepID=UPI00222EF932|nr:MarR family transcriptional regulator [Bosea sp. NBC_00550]UZF94503.1 MarR family transcriptional regulator [Bosea sp. NBC_00550]
MAQRDEARDGMSRLEQQLCFAIYQAGHAFNRAYRPILAELGLTYPQYLVMLVLWEQDGLTVKELGEKLMLDSGTLTPLLKRLEGAGIIRRERDARDERQVRIRLAEKGEGMRVQGRCVQDAIGKALGGTAQDAARLRDQLDLVRDALLTASKDG